VYAEYKIQYTLFGITWPSSYAFNVQLKGQAFQLLQATLFFTFFYAIIQL